MTTKHKTAQDIRAAYRSRTEKDLNRYQLAALLMSRAPTNDCGGYAGPEINSAAIDAATLTHIGRALSGLAVAQCNREWTPRDESRRHNLAIQAETLAAQYGLTITAHGDPRGYVLRLHGPDIYRNGWGDGFGVA